MNIKCAAHRSTLSSDCQMVCTTQLQQQLQYMAMSAIDYSAAVCEIGRDCAVYVWANLLVAYFPQCEQFVNVYASSV
eukprot:8164-Heterococcus_DN1.PRE.28